MKNLMAIAAAAAAMFVSTQNALAMGDAPMENKQPLTPPHSVEMYLDGFHNFKGQHTLSPDKQLQARYSHYCKSVKPGVFQCLIYDGTGKDAKVTGLEYVVSNEIYQAMSPEEKAMWHPHDGEVDSGMLRMPGTDPETEKKTLAFLRSTWGKTWNMWQPEAELPTGEPKLMWSIDPKQINSKTKATMAAREKDYNF
jgi:hypothetical protein